MFEDRLATGLVNRGYQKIDSNVSGIYMFYHADENELITVSIIHTGSQIEITKEQYEHVLEQVKRSLRNSFPQRMRFLSLILTKDPGRVKHLCVNTPEDTHWIVDLSRNQLIIYENQSTDCAGLRELIDEFLIDERSLEEERQTDSADFSQASNDNRRRINPQRLTFITPMNSIIIGVNIIAFFILYFLPILGGEQQMLSKGALSWYYVLEEKEYYRILTSMFMHADWSHLFNNMLVLLFVGVNLERAAGKIRYLIIYFGTGIIAGLTSISYNMWKDYGQFSMEGSTFSIGASGAIFGIVGAMLFIVIINRGKLENINTRQMVLFVFFSLYGGISNSSIDQAAHVGGFLAGIVLAAIVYRRSRIKGSITDYKEFL